MAAVPHTPGRSRRPRRAGGDRPARADRPPAGGGRLAERDQRSGRPDGGAEQ
ncbi:hypothetical protein NJO91_26620 [Streptomyces microflavus]|nr:hypothetical protein [Streptomyces microflavus]